MNRKDGSSDIIRGLQIVIAKPTTPKTAADKVLRELDRKVVQIAKLLDDRKAQDDDSESSRKLRRKAQEQAVQLRASIRELMDRPASDTVAVTTIQKHFVTLDSLFESEALLTPLDAVRRLKHQFRLGEAVSVSWIDFLRSATRDTATTDVDGKYEFRGVLPGEYLIVAEHSNADSFFRWVIEVRVAEGERAKIDLATSKATLRIQD